MMTNDMNNTRVLNRNNKTEKTLWSACENEIDACYTEALTDNVNILNHIS
ncbi:MAG: hypothetical protein K8S87_01780 [Planctomycetes bacterium]|nr:hypothetical protein [Planctomycetota bacterium]